MKLCGAHFHLQQNIRGKSVLLYSFRTDLLLVIIKQVICSAQAGSSVRDSVPSMGLFLSLRHFLNAVNLQSPVFDSCTYVSTKQKVKF